MTPTLRCGTVRADRDPRIPSISSTFAVPVRSRTLALLGSLALILALAPGLPASAQETFTVDSTADDPDADPGDGDCATASGDCTLRAAVQEANHASQDVMIEVPAGDYVLTTGTEIEVTNTGHSITIQGDGVDATVIDGDDTTRIFAVAADAHLSLTGVTLQNGSTDTSETGAAVRNEGTLAVADAVFRENASGHYGGAIHNEGVAELADVTFENNSADTAGRIGGAILNRGDLTVAESTFDGNSADGWGGAIANEADLQVTTTTFRNNESGLSGAIDTEVGGQTSVSESVFEGNTALLSGGAMGVFDGEATVETTTFEANSAGIGGAILNLDRLDVTGSTVVGNEADDGGGIFNDGTLTISATTLRGNVASGEDGSGGALLNDTGATMDVTGSTIVGNDAEVGGGLSDSGITNMTNVTISGNTATEGGGVHADESLTTLEHVTIARNTADSGGGIFDDLAGTEVGHTLIAENTGGNCAGSDLTSAGHNVTDDETCSLDGSGDQTGVDDAGITDLGDFGGGTLVHALSSGSPAVDAAESGSDDEACVDAEDEPLTQDQRGALRPVDGDGSGTAFCDAGAVEYNQAESFTLSPSDATNETDTEHTVTATVADTPGDASEGITVRFSVGGANDSSGATATDTDGEASFTYTGTNAGDDTITAFADTDGDGTQDEEEPSDTVAKTWQAPESPARTARLWGEDRFLTAIAVSQDTYEDGSAGAVVLARDDVFADALAGTPLAVAQDAPLLLTQTSQLRDEVADEIQRVAPGGSTVYLLGGEEALSETVAGQVADLGHDVVRVYGVDRFGTAVEIAGELGDPDTLMVTTGFDFVDAFTAGPAAVTADAAILLTHGDTMTPTTQSYLDDRDGEFLYAVGGPDVNAYADSDEADESVYGGDRFETAVAVAGGFFDAPTAVGVARADVFADALTGGVHIGRIGGPMLVTPSTSLQADVADHLCGNADTIATAYVYGGVVAVSQATEDAVADRITGEGC